MPEGHTVHRLAGQISRRFGGRLLTVDSPQGRFEAGAGLLDGQRLARTDAHGKHLFVGFVPPSASRRVQSHLWLHVHLGLYGKWAFGAGEPPEVRGALRLRWLTLDGDAGPGEVDRRAWAELRGPTACEVLDRAEVAAVRTALGPDPLRPDADPTAFVDSVRRTRAPIAALLMRQDVLAGVGNVYRAESLFRWRLDPLVPGRDVPEAVLLDLWDDLTTLMRAGVRTGRIVTTEPEDRGGHRGRLGAHYVYRRAGEPCRVCGTTVEVTELAGRRLYWCPVCQAPARHAQVLPSARPEPAESAVLPALPG